MNNFDNNELFFFVSGRYHEGYSESGYGQYDAASFQTVPGSGSGTGGGGGGGVGGDQWGSMGPLSEHLSHHPAFLAGLGPRDSSNPHHPSAIGNNSDQKPLLQSAMLAGYTGMFTVRIKYIFNSYLLLFYVNYLRNLKSD